MGKVQFGSRELELGGKYLTELRESNDIFHDTEKLRERLKEDGYLLIRGFHDRERVLKARMEFLQKLAEGGALAPGTPVAEGIIGEGRAHLGKIDANHFPCFYQVVNHPSVFAFFDRLLGGKTVTLDFKWARVVGRGGNTGAHYDIVYMGRGTANLYTLWTPFGDLPPEMGTLAILPGSHRWEQVIRTYGRMDVDRDNPGNGGWLSNDPVELVEKFGGQWATTSFRAGDAILFGMYTMHGSLTNTTNRYRLSADTRYQLEAEARDERWVGDNPKGHYAWGKGRQIPMPEAREKWGI